MPSNRYIWGIAYPIILSLLAQNMINVADTAFLGRVGEVELGAAAIAGIFYIVLYMVGFGFSMGAQILMGRRNGEGNLKQVGNIMDHSLYFLLIIGIVMFVAIYFFAGQMLRPFITSDAVYEASVVYLQYRVYGVFFAFFNVMSRAFFISIQRTRLLTVSAALMATVNVILNYLLIFGHWGFPAMGIAGAAIASAIAEGCSALFFMIYFRFFSNRKQYALFRFPKVSFVVIRQTLDVSVFVMIQYLLSLGAWFLFFVIIEKMGERSLAVSNIVRSLYMILMIPVWAFSSTANTLVTNAIGQKKTNLVLPVLLKVTKLSFLSSVAMVLPMLMIPRLLISIYTNDASLVDDSIGSIYMIFGATLMFSISQVFFSGVSGTGNTRDALIIESFALAIYLIIIYMIVIQWSLPITVAWLCEHVYFLILGSASWIYLRSGRWQGKKI